MKRFIRKGVAFLLPVILLYVFMALFYTTDKGDILRVGYIMDFNKDYRTIFKDEFDRKIYFKMVSELDLDKPQEFTVMTVGDSFSEQNQYGYKNYLAEKSNGSLLHYDSFMNDNPIQTLSGLVNGDFFDKVKVKYVVLQSVERYFATRVRRFDSVKKISMDSVKRAIRKHIPKPKDDQNDKFFSDRMLKFPLYNIKYQFDDNAYSSDIYKVKTNDQLFSVPEKELLFYYEDLINFPKNGNSELIEKLNIELNRINEKLKARNITLIVLPAPDKSDFYFDEIANRSVYRKPVFFDQMAQMNKQYIYIDSKKALQVKMKGRKDIYFYDDTHWSPWSSKIIADTIYNIIRLQQHNSSTGL